MQYDSAVINFGPKAKPIKPRKASSRKRAKAVLAALTAEEVADINFWGTVAAKTNWNAATKKEWNKIVRQHKAKPRA